MTTALKDSLIQINTPLPGPKAQAILDRREAAVVRGNARATPLVAERAEGAMVTDVDGNTFIDMAGGIGAMNVGHVMPGIKEAVHEQVDKLWHLCSIVGTYEPMVALSEKLNELAPISGPLKTILLNSGVEAGENAVKIARYATKRHAIIVFEGAFHGRSLLGMTMTSKYDLFKRGFGPFCSDVYRIPYPYPFRCSRTNCGGSTCVGSCIDELHKAFTAQVSPESVAAVIIEPVLGEGGFIPAPPEYLQALRRICDDHGILLASDEVQTGFCRTGKMFAIEHAGVEPDMLITAKSIGAGLPISAVTGKADIMDAPHPGGLGSTYGGNPVACASALATIDHMEKHKLADRANEVGKVIMDRFRQWQAKYEFIGDVRGLGAMCAMEFVMDPKTKEPNKQAPVDIVQEAFQRGLIMIRAGLYTSCLRILCPLVITDEQLEEAMTALEAAVHAAYEKWKTPR
ncbi:4-aminobutyrate--2-oxoglutarate transaminase [Mucisphaera sp.]|uniref:4-aminobutyrate--2-oxoglutarate transaminase n=1 Tax=Mucisphaera sp. TaxID=2913024 RepID=UPI003D13CBF2